MFVLFIVIIGWFWFRFVGLIRFWLWFVRFRGRFVGLILLRGVRFRGWLVWLRSMILFRRVCWNRRDRTVLLGDRGIGFRCWLIRFRFIRLWRWFVRLVRFRL